MRNTFAKLLFICSVLMLAAGCDNLFSPLSTDSVMTPQGRLERAKQFLREGNFARAEAETRGAIGADSSLSEGWYTLAEIGAWQYNVNIYNTGDSVAALGDSTRKDSTPVPFSRLSASRKDSILTGNLIIIRNLNVIRSGKPSPGSGKKLDSVFLADDLYFNYTVACGVLGLVSLFDNDSNGVIDSVDTVKQHGIRFSYGNSLFKITDLDTTDTITAISTKRAYKKSLSYFSQAKIAAESLLVPYKNDKTQTGYTYRKTIRDVIGIMVTSLSSAPKVRAGL